jgi:pyruvate dehydrogenase E1 component
VVTALGALARRGQMPAESVKQAITQYRLWDVAAGTSGNAGGES